MQNWRRGECFYVRKLSQAVELLLRDLPTDMRPAAVWREKDHWDFSRSEENVGRHDEPGLEEDSNRALERVALEESQEPSAFDTRPAVVSWQGSVEILPVERGQENQAVPETSEEYEFAANATYSDPRLLKDVPGAHCTEVSRKDRLLWSSDLLPHGIEIRLERPGIPELAEPHEVRGGEKAAGH